ncbi:MAG: hypothetical protein O2779_01950 [Nanoarchaeota archaeon]|nr:hypothetical protein [Nanoarchaeota archaeon]
MSDEIIEEEMGETIYDEAGRKDLVESDEMSAGEEAFMQGYEDASEEDEDEQDEEEELEN